VAERVEPTHWQVAVSRLLLQLVQEVHALNPGIRIESDLTLLIAYVKWADEHQERRG
jgi:hypothetical protein